MQSTEVNNSSACKHRERTIKPESRTGTFQISVNIKAGKIKQRNTSGAASEGTLEKLETLSARLRRAAGPKREFSAVPAQAVQGSELSFGGQREQGREPRSPCSEPVRGCVRPGFEPLPGPAPGSTRTAPAPPGGPGSPRRPPAVVPRPVPRRCPEAGSSDGSSAPRTCSCCCCCRRCRRRCRRCRDAPPEAARGARREM